MKSTTNYGLKKPDVTDFYDVDVQNENMDIIDRQLKKLEGGGEVVDNLLSTSTDLPLSANQGRILGEQLNGITLKPISEADFETLATKDSNTLYLVY